MAKKDLKFQRGCCSKNKVDEPNLTLDGDKSDVYEKAFHSFSSVQPVVL